VFNNINSLRANTLATVFARKPYAILTVEGMPNIRSESIEKAEQVLQHMNDIANFEETADNVHLQAFVFGIAATFTKWTMRKERVPVRDEEYRIQTDDFGEPLFEKKIVAEYAETIPIDIRRVRIDPSIDRIQDRRICGHETVMPLTELLDLNKDSDSYFNFDEKEISATSFDSTSYYEKVYGERDIYADKGTENEDFGDKIHWIREIRGQFRVPDKQGNLGNGETMDLIVALGNSDKLLGAKRNDLPIKGWNLYDFPTVDSEPGRVFPMGVVEPIMDLWVEKFIKKNQSIDESNRATYDRYIADKAATQEWDDIIEHSPEQVLKVDLFATGARSVSDVFMPMARPTGTRQDTFTHSQVLSEEIQQGMRVNDYVQGSDPGRKETATAVDALVGGGRALLEKMIKTLKFTFYAPVWRKQLLLYNFFKGHEENVVQDANGKNIPINPGELDFYYKIDIDTTIAHDRPNMIRRFVETFPLLLQDPFIDGFELRKAMLEVLKIPNPEKLLPPSEVEAMNIDRENAGLALGAVLPVSPFDKHELHIEGHADFLQYAASRGLQQDFINNIEHHIEEHQAELEQAQGSLANTKGSDAGQGNGPDAGATKNKLRS